LVRTVPSRIRWRVDTSSSPPLFAKVGNKLSYVERSSISYKNHDIQSVSETYPPVNMTYDIPLLRPDIPTIHLPLPQRQTLDGNPRPRSPSLPTVSDGPLDRGGSSVFRQERRMYVQPRVWFPEVGFEEGGRDDMAE
jgi:hypothetical protein